MLMFRFVWGFTSPAFVLGEERNGWKWDDPAVDHQDDVGPLMAHDKALPMVEALRILNVK